MKIELGAKFLDIFWVLFSDFEGFWFGDNLFRMIFDNKVFVTMALDWEFCVVDFELLESFFVKIKETKCKALKIFKDLERDSTQLWKL